MKSDDLTTTLDISIDEADERVRAALAAEGFGVLTEIDVQATLREKLDVERTPYRILGACNPPLAHRSLTIDPDIGLLLPCNVVLQDVEGTTQVSVVDPSLMATATDIAELADVAAEARERLVRVVAAL